MIYTAQFDYSGPDRINITRWSRRPDRFGILFAPSAEILSAAKTAQGRAKVLMADAAMAAHDGDRTAAEAASKRIEDDAWASYEAAYRNEMRKIRKWEPGSWQKMLDKPRVVLVCFCPSPERCHRRLLAEMLAEDGATYMGEVESEKHR
jgi:hypothetical protein